MPSLSWQRKRKLQVILSFYYRKNLHIKLRWPCKAFNSSGICHGPGLEQVAMKIRGEWWRYPGRDDQAAWWELPLHRHIVTWALSTNQRPVLPGLTNERPGYVICFVSTSLLRPSSPCEPRTWPGPHTDTASRHASLHTGHCPSVLPERFTEYIL